jgi:hypothetical protein
LKAFFRDVYLNQKCNICFCVAITLSIALARKIPGLKSKAHIFLEEKFSIVFNHSENLFEAIELFEGIKLRWEVELDHVFYALHELFD